MTKTSMQLPQVPLEPPILKIPLFLNKSQQMTSYVSTSLCTACDGVKKNSQAITLFRSLTNDNIQKVMIDVAVLKCSLLMMIPLRSSTIKHSSGDQ